MGLWIHKDGRQKTVCGKCGFTIIQSVSTQKNPYENSAKNEVLK